MLWLLALLGMGLAVWQYYYSTHTKVPAYVAACLGVVWALIAVAWVYLSCRHRSGSKCDKTSSGLGQGRLTTERNELRDDH